MVAMGGNLGLTADIGKVPAEAGLRPDQLLFSETPGRFLVTVSPEMADAFESLLEPGQCALVGEVTDSCVLDVRQGPRKLLEMPVRELKSAWKTPFGGLV
jgi:phosphoribosylformylglycinamidine synthase